MAATADAFWGLLAVLAAALLTYGILRDRNRPTKAVAVVAVVCSLVLLGAAALFGWGAYQQQRAETAACKPLADC